MKQEYKPGPGWKKLNPAVYEKGVFRIHVGGGIIKSLILGRVTNVEDRKMFKKFLKINGNNKKRGLMAYANHFRFGV
ncbi:MAG: hypothetical protein HOE30_23275 [Deltaproteobacteria bacterium]|nr:hypothetical protein [Deltaproteobacteria bacterium]